MERNLARLGIHTIGDLGKANLSTMNAEQRKDLQPCRIGKSFQNICYLFKFHCHDDHPILKQYNHIVICI